MLPSARRLQAPERAKARYQSQGGIYMKGHTPGTADILPALVCASERPLSLQVPWLDFSAGLEDSRSGEWHNRSQCRQSEGTPRREALSAQTAGFPHAPSQPPRTENESLDRAKPTSSRRLGHQQGARGRAAQPIAGDGYPARTWSVFPRVAPASAKKRADGRTIAIRSLPHKSATLAV